MMFDDTIKFYAAAADGNDFDDEHDEDDLGRRFDDDEEEEVTMTSDDDETGADEGGHEIEVHREEATVLRCRLRLLRAMFRRPGLRRCR